MIARESVNLHRVDEGGGKGRHTVNRDSWELPESIAVGRDSLGTSTGGSVVRFAGRGEHESANWSITGEGVPKKLRALTRRGEGQMIRLTRSATRRGGGELDLFRFPRKVFFLGK